MLKPHQRDFLLATEQYVGLFGGIGNGKTTVGCEAILADATQSSDNLCLVGRQTYPELRDSTREVFLNVLRSKYPEEAFKFNKAENSITFWNKSAIIFRHLDNLASLLSTNLGSFYIDQAEEVDEDAFLTLQGRLRRPNVKRRRGYITGNPAGHNWVYYKFGMDKAGASANWKHNDDYRMITAPTIANSDNLPENYITQLKGSYSPEWFERYVMGSWDAFEGQIFDLTKITGYETLPEILMVLTACDPAISKEDDACNTAFSTVGIGADGHFYDLETIAGKWSFFETLEQAKRIVSRRFQSQPSEGETPRSVKAYYLGVEDNGYQAALVEACQRYFQNISVVSLHADKDKFRRAKSVSHIIQMGLYHTNNQSLLSEISAFRPDAKGKSKKDQVDALVHALHMAQKYAPWIDNLVSPNDAFKGMTAGQAWFKQTRDYRQRQRSGEDMTETFNESDIHSDENYY